MTTDPRDTSVITSRRRYNPFLRTAMRKKRRTARRQHFQADGRREGAESRASEAVTIAWTVSVTGVLVCDLIVAAAHWYVRSHPNAQPARAFEAIMLLSAALMGAVSLALLPVVWRTRRLKPPQGYVVFAALVAAAPIIVLAARLL
jgi:hypothetical protein